MVLALQRMHELAEFVKTNSDVLCLLGLGSMSEVNRADAYSDMDFFIIVHDDAKLKFLEDLFWLKVRPLTYAFKNSNDGYKILYDDGVYGEFAVFTKDELANAHFTKGIIYYKQDDFDASLVIPSNAPKLKPIDIEHNINEALTNIYIGLKRLHRGELASATTFIQVHAYQNTIVLFDVIFNKLDTYSDPYVFERRIEYRYKPAKLLLEKMRPGYLHNQLAANTILKFLMDHFNVNTHIIREIQQMLT